MRGKSVQFRRIALLGGSAIALTATAQTAAAQSADENADNPNEIIVTAQKRTQALQDVPISIIALTTEKLQNLQVRNFVDYIAYLPSASFTTGSTGTPGNNSVSFRGIVSSGGLITSGTLPTVGTYLDEQPITSILGTVDIHVYDIARVEALAGPQGTLYGASSQAGTVRIISNKPDLTRFSGRADAEINTISNGALGGQLEGFVNLPIVPDRVALRVVGWYEQTGGYIDNVFNARTFPSSGITQRNDALVEKNHNPVDIVGLRAQLGINLDDSHYLVWILECLGADANQYIRRVIARLNSNRLVHVKSRSLRTQRFREQARKCERIRMVRILECPPPTFL